MINLDFSLIIPCYNEEAMLKNSLNQILEVLNATRFNYEIIFIDDCSTDGTVNIIRQLIKDHPEIAIKSIFHEQNEGRGKTVNDGILNSEANIVGFIDIDLSTHARYIPCLIIEIKKGADIATALRVYKPSWSTMPRWILSKGYKFLVKLLLGLGIKDTETGCKFFNKDSISPVLSEVRDAHWFWDTEIMVRSYIKGLKVVEIPSVFIRKGLYSRVKIFKDSASYFINLIRFRQELKRKNLL